MNMLESIKSCNKNLLSFVLGGSGLHLNKLPEKGQYALVFPYVIQILYYVIQILYYYIHFLLTWYNFVPQGCSLNSFSCN